MAPRRAMKQSPGFRVRESMLQPETVVSSWEEPLRLFSDADYGEGHERSPVPGGADFRSAPMGLRPDEKRRIHVGQVGNLRPIDNRPSLACKRVLEPGDAFFDGAHASVRPPSVPTRGGGVPIRRRLPTCPRRTDDFPYSWLPPEAEGAQKSLGLLHDRRNEWWRL